MSRKEQVARVLAATVTTTYDDAPELNYTSPLITTGDELYFFTEEQVVAFVRRILAAADGVSNFTQQVRPTPVHHTPPRRRARNLVAYEAYRARRHQPRK